MTDDSFSSKLRELSKNYYQNHISFTEYRAARRSLLQQIDEEFNGKKITPTSETETEESSIFMKTVAFFANTDLKDEDKKNES